MITSGGFLKDGVGVGAAHPERGDAGPPRPFTGEPGHRLGKELNFSG
jgi:hypothetical protein